LLNEDENIDDVLKAAALWAALPRQSWCHVHAQVGTDPVYEVVARGHQAHLYTPHPPHKLSWGVMTIRADFYIPTAITTGWASSFNRSWFVN
jgi:hypothetical protein